MIVPAAAAFSLLSGMTAMAAVHGHLDWASQTTIAGWAWDDDAPEESVEVYIEITPDGAEAPAISLTAAAESYRGDLESSIGSAGHGFYCPVDWSGSAGGQFTITAYVMNDGEKTALAGVIPCDLSEEGPYLALVSEEDEIVLSAGPETESDIPLNVGPGASEGAETAGPDDAGNAEPGAPDDGKAAGPGASGAAQKADTGAVSGPSANGGNPEAAPTKTEPSVTGPGASGSLSGPGSKGPGSSSKSSDSADTAEISSSGWKKGASLGIFTTTGYCNCEQCSSSGLTYSGTVPKANHTIAADINILPIGTKVMINGIVYTVEDIGSAVKGNMIDIYYDTHEGAVNHGWQQAEVFAVIEE